MVHFHCSFESSSDLHRGENVIIDRDVQSGLYFGVEGRGVLLRLDVSDDDRGSKSDSWDLGYYCELIFTVLCIC